MTTIWVAWKKEYGVSSGVGRGEERNICVWRGTDLIILSDILSYWNLLKFSPTFSFWLHGCRIQLAFSIDKVSSRFLTFSIYLKPLLVLQYYDSDSVKVILLQWRHLKPQTVWQAPKATTVSPGFNSLGAIEKPFPRLNMCFPSGWASVVFQLALLS